MRTIKSNWLIFLLTLLLIIAALFSLFTGVVALSITDIFRFDDLTADGVIFWEIRVPRTLVAIFAGATLALAGASMQGFLRNPLASPGLLGNASGAALCAVILLYFASHLYYLLPFVGMFGSFVALTLVLLLAGRNASITVLILAGVAINTLCAAAMALVLNLADSPWAMNELYLWTQGSLANATSRDIVIMIAPMVVGWWLLIRHGRDLDALTFGEDTAASLGVDLSVLKRNLVLALSLAIGAVIPITGIIGFVGLVVPHLLRPLTGYQPSRLLIPSALLGALFLLLADMLVRSIETQQELRIGVLTSIIGGPFFIVLLIRYRKELF